jgi:hypothetical protein
LKLDRKIIFVERAQTPQIDPGRCFAVFLGLVFWPLSGAPVFGVLVFWPGRAAQCLVFWYFGEGRADTVKSFGVLVFRALSQAPHSLSNRRRPLALAALRLLHLALPAGLAYTG